MSFRERERRCNRDCMGQSRKERKRYVRSLEVASILSGSTIWLTPFLEVRGGKVWKKDRNEVLIRKHHRIFVP
jgi:hypothetical protein